jgi:predicted NAD/FAD-binding protein
MSVVSEGKRIAVIGSGISGLSSAWLLSQKHEVTLYEAAPRLGGHSFTTDVAEGGGRLAVDMGFIVYNERTYPNLTALFAHLGVETRATDMSFAVSLEGGAVEYGGLGLAPLLARPSNLLRPRFWSMLRDLVRFYREAPVDRPFLDDETTLGDYLSERGYGAAFRDDHLLPQAAAIWSAPVEAVCDFPAASFIRFFENHGLLKLVGRPLWRTVQGGSRAYVQKLAEPLGERVRTGVAVKNVRREGEHVWVSDSRGVSERFDAVVIATHAREALAMLHHPTSREESVLGAFGYTSNLAVLHTDVRLMPRRAGVWSAWNYVGGVDAQGHRKLCVTYWMNLLQGLKSTKPLLVTLNPVTPPDPAQVLCSETFQHPVFDHAALRAQRLLWSLQGQGGVWFCGAHFGAGFHEDGLQAGLAVAEALGGVRRPWSVAEESGRIFIGAAASRALAA